MAIIGASIVLALIVPYISPYDYRAMTHELFSPPTWKNPMGTDNHGRDLFSRVLWGTRVSLFVAFVAGGLSFVIGLFLGAISGYHGGMIDTLTSRFVEIFLMIPQLFLLILINALFGPNIVLMTVMLGLTMWPSNARLARAQTLTIKKRAFVEASLGMGRSRIGVLLSHIIPNGISPILVNAVMQMRWAIFLEASISFLGMGDLNHVSWGQLLYFGRLSITHAWWAVFFPGLAIFILVFAFNMVGDRLYETLNPRLRARW